MTTNGRVLIVDDEGAIRRLLRNTLERAGYVVTEAVNGRDALVAAHGVDAILLDLGLPDRDGLSLVPLLKKAERVLIVVSAREAADEKIAALDLGADDYVTKPFDSEELLARLRASLRRRSVDGDPEASLTVGTVRIDQVRRRVTRDGDDIHLTQKEFEVLVVLARNAGKVVTHDGLIAAAWRANEDPRIEYLRIVIRNLRAKLEAPAPVGSLIANELGVGYRLVT